MMATSDNYDAAHLRGDLAGVFFRFPDPAGLAFCRRTIPLFAHEVCRAGSLKGAMRACAQRVCFVAGSGSWGCG